MKRISLGCLEIPKKVLHKRIYIITNVPRLKFVIAVKPVYSGHLLLQENGTLCTGVRYIEVILQGFDHTSSRITVRYVQVFAI